MRNQKSFVNRSIWQLLWLTRLSATCDTHLMEQTHTTPTAAPAAAPWRNRMVPGTAPAPVYANDAPLSDAPARPPMSADRAALYALHAPASIASVPRANPTVGNQGWGDGRGMADPRTLPAQSSSCWA